ncbi:5-oxoprolinase subunit B family protein [Ornithinimicrobium tianjinense]|uniref:Carboxyltransferase domain-containing protein n=1 Tax=Ornithinimicrobium tianjinense TaxID=1195761 RepID=A0A917F3F4_9MICO|nr:allophanate hydrolase subunit 1 [Ornithinimicrobium tianjinense]GGF46431.1 hypothetical protein GCM10011366_12690 [Ornithinimicrobium tianjinense]
MGDVPMRLLPMGEEAILVETEDIASVLRLRTLLADLVETGEGAWAQVAELVPAARTVLVVTTPGADLAALAGELRHLDTAAAGDHVAQHAPEEVEIVVRYDGPDLEDVAGLTGMTPEEVVAAHTQTPWQVGFGGFAPGFAYLVGGDPRLLVPRRSTPRTKVPAGAVGLAGEFSGIYPRESPGGWQLLGTTDAVLWDADREHPALLRPGAVVRFVEAS